MIVGAPRVGARNADNTCQCEHCFALPSIARNAMHCPHCPALTIMALIALVVWQWMAMWAPTSGAPTIDAEQCPHCSAIHMALPCIAMHCSHCPTLPRIAPHRPSWRSWRSLWGNGWHCGHPRGVPLLCSALPCTALHCSALLRIAGSARPWLIGDGQYGHCGWTGERCGVWECVVCTVHAALTITMQGHSGGIAWQHISMSC